MEASADVAGIGCRSCARRHARADAWIGADIARDAIRGWGGVRHLHELMVAEASLYDTIHRN